MEAVEPVGVGANALGEGGANALVVEVGALSMMTGATLTTGVLGGKGQAGEDGRSTLASGGLSTA